MRTGSTRRKLKAPLVQYRGAAAREQHCADSTAAPAPAPMAAPLPQSGGCTNQGAESCGGANGRGFLAVAKFRRKLAKAR